MSTRRALNRYREGGAAFVELVLSLPILIILLVGAGDFARVMYLTIEMTNAARAGAQYGALTLAQSKDFTRMQSTALAAAPNISGMTAVGTRFCQCATNSGVFSSLAPGTTCDDAPATSCPGTHRVTTVTVTTTASFSTIAGFVGIPRTLSAITRSATLRVAE